MKTVDSLESLRSQCDQHWVCADRAAKGCGKGYSVLPSKGYCLRKIGTMDGAQHMDDLCVNVLQL